MDSRPGIEKGHIRTTGIILDNSISTMTGRRKSLRVALGKYETRISQ